jgi:Uma2 family endonuclease
MPVFDRVKPALMLAALAYHDRDNRQQAGCPRENTVVNYRMGGKAVPLDALGKERLIMSTIAASQSTPGALVDSTWRPPLYRFTVSQFDRMVRDGTIGSQDRVELIDGLVVTRMSKKPPHILGGKLLFAALTGIVPTGWHVTKDDDVVVSEHDKPQPDLAVVRGSPRDYRDKYATPDRIALAVEISESTLTSDQSVKMPRYAAASIPVYWIVDLVHEQVEVHTDPSGGRYAKRAVFTRGQEVPVVIDGALVSQITVSEILP